MLPHLILNNQPLGDLMTPLLIMLECLELVLLRSKELKYIYVYFDNKCEEPVEVSNIQDSEWWQIVPACCAALCSKKTSLKSLVLQVSVLQTDRSSPLLRLLPGRLVLQTPARGGAVSANLISPSQHARSLSAPRPSSPAGFRVIGEGWRSAALFSSFRDQSHTCAAE